MTSGSQPPSLPPVVKGAKDGFSGGGDILVQKGLKSAYNYFSNPASAITPIALDCDEYMGGISAGFELRQGRAMELAPLMETTLPPQPVELRPLDRERMRVAFTLKPTPYRLPEEERAGVVRVRLHTTQSFITSVSTDVLGWVRVELV